MLKREQQEDTSRWQLGKYVKLRATCMSSSHLNEVSGLSVQDTLLPIKHKFPWFTVFWKNRHNEGQNYYGDYEDGSALEFMIM